MTVPLSVLDLAPIVSGSNAPTAFRRTIELARDAEALGYHRYWLAEHHLTPGIASSSPAVLIGAVASATSTIRVGAGAVQTGYHTAVSIVEQFATLEALHPGRIDLGLGRSAQRIKTERDPNRPKRPPREAHEVDGLIVPKPYPLGELYRAPRFRYHASLLKQPGAEGVDYGDLVADVLTLLGGPLSGPEGLEAIAVPSCAAASSPEVILFGSSPGQSAQVAGERALSFAANYHITPWSTLDAVEAYRAAFVPSAARSIPHVLVSADVVVADDDASARQLAVAYAHWVRSIRSESGAVPFPSDADVAAALWSAEDDAVVADRVDTQFVGSPATVVEQLRTLQRVTGADELVVTTIVHDHEQRRRSFALLAEAWGLGRG